MPTCLSVASEKPGSSNTSVSILMYFISLVAMGSRSRRKGVTAKPAFQRAIHILRNRKELSRVDFSDISLGVLRQRAPTRYFTELIEMGFWEALGRFLKYREWSWTRIQFHPVYKGQPGYDDAPYEESWVWTSVDFPISAKPQ